MKNRLHKTIVSGKYKGKKLLLPSKETTRSSKAIVLESFFNTIQFDIVDATFIELFSGSGSIGLEALSRGAKEVIFFERDKDAIKILRENISQTDPSKCSVIEGDTFSNINQVINRLKKEQKRGYFYIDPPFSFRDGMDEIYDKTIHLIKTLPSDVVELIIIEHMSTLALDNSIGEYELLKSKKFGNTTLSYFG